MLYLRSFTNLYPLPKQSYTLVIGLELLAGCDVYLPLIAFGLQG